jgi:hypothetical protein
MFGIVRMQRWYARRVVRSTATDAPRAPTIEPALLTAPKPTPATTARLTTVERPAPHRPPPHIVHEAATPPRIFQLAPNPKAVRVWLDGQPLGDYGPQLAQLAVGAGRHVVRFSSPYCFPQEIEIAPDAPSGHLATRLRWKPARLTVHTDPASADILIGEVSEARRGASREAVLSGMPGMPVVIDGTILHSDQPLDVSIPELSDGKRMVMVKVSAPGYATRKLAVELRASDHHIESVTLAALDDPTSAQ